MQQIRLTTTKGGTWRPFNGCLVALLVCALVAMHAAGRDVGFCGVLWSDSADVGESVELSLPRSAEMITVSPAKPRRSTSCPTSFSGHHCSTPALPTLPRCNCTFRSEYDSFSGVGAPLLL